jgi:hypothetical protein
VDDDRPPICPACGVTMLLDPETDEWVCAECLDAGADPSAS